MRRPGRHRQGGGGVIKGLTLNQPWATLVACGAKRIETRSWQTSYRGQLAIHAARDFPVRDRQLARHSRPIAEALARDGHGCRLGPDLYAGSPGDLPLGMVVAVATLGEVDTTRGVASDHGFWHDPEYAFGDYTPGRYAWLLKDVVRIDPPIPCKGTLGLWAVPPEIEALIRGRLAEVTAPAPETPS